MMHAEEWNFSEDVSDREEAAVGTKIQVCDVTQGRLLRGPVGKHSERRNVDLLSREIRNHESGIRNQESKEKEKKQTS